MTPEKNKAPGITAQADHEAATWSLRLEEGPLTPAEQAQLDAWLAHDPRHRTLLAGYGRFCAELDAQLLALAPAQVEAFPVAAATPRRRVWPSLAGLAAAAALVFGIWIAWPTPTPASEAIATAPAERRSLALADGTRADLNAQTRLRVDFTDRRQRLIQMERGEALFTVAKDTARPFIVETPGGRVRVTGTVFNVRTTPAGALDVTVLEGSVEVLPSTAREAISRAPLQLGAGDQVALEGASLSVRRGEPELATEAAAWREGRIVFDGVPLAEALARYAHYHGRTIVVAPEVAERRIGGRYPLDDLPGFLNAISGALPVRVTEEPDGRVRVTAR